jgi:hypothetical protein
MDDDRYVLCMDIDNCARIIDTVTGKTKFKTAKNSFWTQKNKASVVIDAKSVWDIPEDFRRYKDPEPDKTKIGKAIAAGQDFTGIAHMEQTESVRIK